MEKVYIHRLEAFDRLIDLLEDNVITPAIPRVTALTTQMIAIATTLRGHAAGQVNGHYLFRSGASSRKAIAREVRMLMRPINRIAWTLDREEYPGVRDRFRMPAQNRYEALIGTARAFVTAMEEEGVKTLFTDRGLGPTFDEDLSAKVDELVEITDVKNVGLADRVGATEGTSTVSSGGLKVMRELEAILKVVWANDPVLLASLKTACRVRRPKQKDDGEEMPAVPEALMAAVSGEGVEPEVLAA